MSSSNVKENGSESESELSKKKKESKHKKSSKSKKEGKEHHRDETSSPVKDSSQSKKDMVKMDSGIILWELALQESQQAQENQAEEKTIIFVGSKASGKTTVILRFLDRDEIPKPTTALEYTYGRKARGNNLDKDVAHIWELGGGTWLSKLADIVVCPEAIKNTSLALVVDLSKPNELWLTIEKWVEVLKGRIESIIADAKDTDSMLKERLKKAAWQRIGEDNTDYDLIDPFLVQLVIIGTKYDIFQDFDADKRKVICKSLRFVAHKYGAHLQFCSTIKHESLLSKTRAIVNHFVFGTPISKSIQADHNKPISISAGQDSFQEIGGPPLQDGDVGRLAAKSPMDLWKHAFVKYFPQEITADPSLVDDPAKDKQFSEPAVDTMRVQKDEELVRYRRACERRSKEVFSKSFLEGVTA